MSGRSLLVFGATGKTGKYVVEHALTKGWKVHAFVRNPARVPEEVRSKIDVIQGNLNDPASVQAAVKASKPNAIIDCSSALPFGHEKGNTPNDADRGVAIKAGFEALQADNRLEDCYVLIQGGVVIPEPGGQILYWMPWFINVLLRWFAPSMWAKVQQYMNWMFHETPQAFRFSYYRMGYADAIPSRGTLQLEVMKDNIQRGVVAFCDVGRALVELAGDDAASRRFHRQAFVFNYHT